MTGLDFLKDDLYREFSRRGVIVEITDICGKSVLYIFTNIGHDSIRFNEVNFGIRNLLQTDRIARTIADAIVSDTDSKISEVNLGSCWDDISDLGFEWFLDKYDLDLKKSFRYTPSTTKYNPYSDFVKDRKSKEVKRIIFSGPATIVFWGDGTKTVVKCQEGDVFDEEKGFAMAFLKHSLGNKANYNNYINKALKNADYQLDEDTFLLSKAFTEAIKKIFDEKEKEKK